VREDGRAHPLDGVVMRLLEKNPARRYLNAHAALEAVRLAMMGQARSV
jgi:hypothetical protein